jgi:bis(5'-adenosyl)-triphosphatase
MAQNSSRTVAARNMALARSKPLVFGDFTVTPQSFHSTPYSFAFVNIKPILPGHVLVSPIRRVPRLADLTPEEVQDLFLTVQKVGHMVERVFHASSLNIAIQDGVDAGQSVAHLHAHIIPRRPADMPNTDDVYAEMDGPHGNIGRHFQERHEGSFPSVDSSIARPARSDEDMVKEADWLRAEMDVETA